MPISAGLREHIRSGQARPEEKLAVCAGGAGISPEDRVELLAVLAKESDSALAERAQSALLVQPLQSFVAAAERADADLHLFLYCAASLGDKPGIADALARNVACPIDQVTPLARHLTAVGIQSLLDNIERFVSDSDLVAAVCASAHGATAEQKEWLAELQKTVAGMNTKEFEDAAASLEPDGVKRQSLLQKVSQMNVVQRITLALKGGRTERMLLIHDTNKLVQKCVLQSPRLTDAEVESFSCMTNMSAEILRSISMSRVFMKNYIIVKNLTSNPKTPLDVSLHLFPRLNAPDLVKLAANKNVPETLRSSAQKLHRKRKVSSPGA